VLLDYSIKWMFFVALERSTGRPASQETPRTSLWLIDSVPASVFMQLWLDEPE